MKDNLVFRNEIRILGNKVVTSDNNNNNNNNSNDDGWGSENVWQTDDGWSDEKEKILFIFRAMQNNKFFEENFMIWTQSYKTYKIIYLSFYNTKLVCLWEENSQA